MLSTTSWISRTLCPANICVDDGTRAHVRWHDTMLGTVYILMAVMIVLGAMLGRRGPLARIAVQTVTLATLFTAGFVIFAFRDDLGYLGQRLKTEVTGEPIAVGTTLRVPMAR